MTKRNLVSLFLSMALGAALMGCGEKKSATEEVSETPTHTSIVTLSQQSINQIGLTTETVSLKPFTKSLQIPAKVITNQDSEAHVGSLVAGRVSKTFAKAGDRVKAGQVLMLVEGLEIGEIKAGFLSAKAHLEYQRANYERQKKLFEQNIGAQKDLLETQSEHEKALAEFNAEKNRISAIGLTENDVVDGSGVLAVKSPIAGIVVERNVVIGQAIEATSMAFKVIDLSSVWIDGQMYEKDISKISSTSMVEFTSATYPDKLFSGKIIYVGQVIDEQSRTITVRAEFVNNDLLLKPQMFGELKFQNDINATALLVPAEAVVRIDNADYVFVEKSDTTFEKTSVVTGSVQNELVEIVKGLNAGDKVVVKGAFYVKSENLKSSLGGE